MIRASQERAIPLAAFAQEHGIPRSRLWRWSWRLRNRNGERVLFHPVRLVETQPVNNNPALIEVVLLDGRRVRVAQGFAASDLTRVLAVLDGAVSC